MICRKNDGGGGGPPPTPDAGPPPSGDTTAPSVIIASPSAGAILPTSTKVVVNASDDQGLASVELQIDGTPASTLNAAPYEFTITLQPGAHTLTAIARDTSGNKGEAMVTVTATDQGGTPDPGTPDSGTPDPGTPNPGTPPQPTPSGPAGLFGAACSGPGDCKSGLCVEDSAYNARYCTERCTASNVCPIAGARCLADGSGQSLCVHASQSGLPQNESAAGCATGSNPSDVGSLGLVLLGLLLLVRRRARSR